MLSCSTCQLLFINLIHRLSKKQKKKRKQQQQMADRLNVDNDVSDDDINGSAADSEEAENPHCTSQVNTDKIPSIISMQGSLQRSAENVKK